LIGFELKTSLESKGDGKKLKRIPRYSVAVSGSATDDLLARSKLLRQRMEARNNSSPAPASPSKSSNSEATQLDRVAQNLSTGQNDAFPMLIGNLEDPRKGSFFTFENVMLMFMAVLALPILPFFLAHYLFQQWSFKREYAKNILNPEYLRGTGLMVYSDLSAELITKGKVPPYVFEKEDITVINHHTISYGGRSHAHEIRIHLHDFHALTLYGLTGVEAMDVVDDLVSLYDVEEYHTNEYVSMSDGGGGSGGG
jgi:hypothetical protein